MKRVLLLFVALVTPIFAIAQGTDHLADEFTHPPESARPWTWWHWVSGNVSKEGITADLEAMKQIGLGGAQIFTVDQSDVHGPIKFMSPEWKVLVAHALSEAHRLGLTISMEGCDGWSESGGPWVTPAESMKKVVFNSRYVNGGAKLKLDLPQPETVRDFYKDIAVLAVPCAPGPEAAPIVSASATNAELDADALIHHASKGAKVTTLADNLPVSIQIEYKNPTRAASLKFTLKGKDIAGGWKAEWSPDGNEFKPLGNIGANSTIAFPPVRARVFRISAATAVKGKTASVDLQPGGPIIGDLISRSGMNASMGTNNFNEVAGIEPGDIIDPTRILNLTGKQDWDAPAGQWTVFRVGYTSTGATTHPSTAAGLECDKLSAEAVQHHLANMFDSLFTQSPGLVGNTFKYILLDSWEAGCENWTDRMREEFQARRGYDPVPWLPALGGKIIGSANQTERFLWDLRRTIADLVADNHYKVAQRFAHQHQMGLAAEATGIGMPTVADQLLCKKYCDLPMGEFWVNRSRPQNVDDTKETASAAHVYGQTMAGAEAFTAAPTAAGWAKDPYSLKALGDQQFCLGINKFIFHRYAHQPWLDRAPGITMGPWGTNFERTNTWWLPGRAWMQYITRCQTLLQDGRFQADFCYWYGEAAPVCVRHAGLDPAVPPGFDYDVCNTDALLNLFTVNAGQIMTPSGMRYRVLVLPLTDRITLAAMKTIRVLVEQGATVYGQRPMKSPSLAGGEDAEVARLSEEVWGPCDGHAVTEHAFGKGRVAWGKPLTQLCGLSPDFQADSGDFLFIHRRIGDADVYFVSNQKPEAIRANLSFRVVGKEPEIWHPDTGKRETAAVFQSGSETTTLPLDFDPSGSVFVIFRHVATSHLVDVNFGAGNASPLTTQPHLENEKAAFQMFGNGSYTARTDSGKTLSGQVQDLPAPLTIQGPWAIDFPPKLGAPASANFDHLISWTDSAEDGVKYFSGTAKYTTVFELPKSFTGTHHSVYLDLGEVKNLAEVSVNGRNLGILWKPPFRVDITVAVQPGKNTLAVSVTNLWPNRLIGDSKLSAANRVTWTTYNPYKPDSPLLPSGLLGPVRLIPAETVNLDLK